MKEITQPRKRILVGLSGGVDSAVSAYLLKEAGYEVSCGFMINYLDEAHPESCPTLADLEEAKKVASFLGLPFFTFDYREEYERRIIDYIYAEYEKGNTPNPDVFCNNLVKFDLFLEEAIGLGYDAIATGHYARIDGLNVGGFEGSRVGMFEVLRVREFEGSTEQVIRFEGSNTPTLQHSNIPTLKHSNIPTFQHSNTPTLQLSNTPTLLKGIDPDKDQSYFLSRLSRSQLRKAMFPIGGLLKSEVREIARAAGLPNAERKDSQGLCFIGKVSMKEFLERRFPKKPGDILDTKGQIIGTHEGAFSYTIGQRKGIEIGGGPALFVLSKDTRANRIVVGTSEELSLYSSACTLTEWVGGIPIEGKNYGAKIRYRQEDQMCTCHYEEPSSPDYLKQKSMDRHENLSETQKDFLAMTIEFASPQRAIARGQVCVIYEEDRVVGSGIIG